VLGVGASASAQGTPFVVPAKAGTQSVIHGQRSMISGPPPRAGVTREKSAHSPAARLARPVRSA